MSTYNEVFSQVQHLTSDEQLRLLAELAALVRQKITSELQRQQAKIAELEAQREEVTRQQEELQEEHGGEEGLLAEVTSDAGKVTNFATIGGADSGVG